MTASLCLQNTGRGRRLLAFDRCRVRVCGSFPPPRKAIIFGRFIQTFGILGQIKSNASSCSFFKFWRSVVWEKKRRAFCLKVSRIIDALFICGAADRSSVVLVFLLWGHISFLQKCSIFGVWKIADFFRKRGVKSSTLFLRKGCVNSVFLKKAQKLNTLLVKIDAADQWKGPFLVYIWTTVLRQQKSLPKTVLVLFLYCYFTHP